MAQHPDFGMLGHQGLNVWNCVLRLPYSRLKVAGPLPSGTFCFA